VGTLVVVGVVSVVLTFVLERAARAESSLTLAADAAHYRVDALHTLGGVAGLGLVWLTGLPWLDPIAALGFAVLMSVEAWRIGRRSLGELLDEALSDDEIDTVHRVLEANRGRVLEFHALRTRKAGPQRFVEVHAELDPDMTVAEAHRLVQDVGAQLAAVLPEGTRVLVHPDAGGLKDRVDAVLEGEARVGAVP
jgi:cation diffusion facilitator family transporter